MNAYATDLARVHDEGYGDYARRVTPAVLALLRQRGIDEGLIVEIGCGSGITARELVDRGYEVLGVDQSAAMLRLARRRAPQAKFRRGSYVDVVIPPCRAVIALGEIFNYQFDRRSTKTALTDFFQRACAALAPGGLLVFDLAEPGRGRHVAQSHRMGDAWACLVDYECDAARDRLTRHIVTFCKSGRHFRRRMETHRLQLYRAAEIAQLLRENGFKVRVARKFGGISLPHAMAILIARRP